MTDNPNDQQKPGRPHDSARPPLPASDLDTVGTGGHSAPDGFSWSEIDELLRSPAARTGPESDASGRGVFLRDDSDADRRRPLRCRLRSKCEAEMGQLWGHIFFGVEHLPPKSVIVTAARRSDGATQIATGLALVGAAANTELSIALVDFNLRNSRVAQVLGIPNEPGLTDVLDGRVSLEDAFQPLVLENGAVLRVLASGAPAAQPLGLLKSRQVRSVIDQIKARFDHAIFDVTATNSHPDAQVIGTMVDGAVLVARSGDTPREVVAEAKKRLDVAGVKCLGLVLNQRSDPIPDFLYHKV